MCYLFFSFYRWETFMIIATGVSLMQLEVTKTFSCLLIFVCVIYVHTYIHDTYSYNQSLPTNIIVIPNNKHRLCLKMYLCLLMIYVYFSKQRLLSYAICVGISAGEIPMLWHEAVNSHNWIIILNISSCQWLTLIKHRNTIWILN